MDLNDYNQNRGEEFNSEGATAISEEPTGNNEAYAANSEQPTANSEAPATGKSILRAEGLVKRYGKRTVVNDVHINVRQGEIVGLLGPNGAGKSLIEEFRLGKVRKNKGDQLSGGERRRTEIARCLAIEPKFIMLDEPFAGVDPIAVEDIQHIVWQLKYRNIGILITDHNVHETLNITDRAYLLFEGRILFQGKPEELAANPIVKEKYLGTNFVLQKKDFQLLDEEKRRREQEE